MVELVVGRITAWVNCKVGLLVKTVELPSVPTSILF